MCTEYVKAHIARLSSTQIFTTREVLQYGRRGTVDQALSRMVKAHFIARLARGVFVRDASFRLSRKAIAKAKMAAWNKVLFTHAEKLLIAMRLITANRRAAVMIVVNSHSTSFETIYGRVDLKGIGNRRVHLNTSAVGQIAYALWHLTEKVCSQEHVSEATKYFTRTDRENFRLAAAMMPGWLSDLCQFRFPAPRVSI